ERRNPLRRLAPELEGKVAAHRDAHGNEVAREELEDPPRPAREARVRLAPREVRRDYLVAGLLEHGHLSLPHARVEWEGVQKKEDAHSRGMSTAPGISPARSYPWSPPSTPSSEPTAAASSSAGGSSSGLFPVMMTRRTSPGLAPVSRATTVGFAASEMMSPGGTSP